MNKVKEIATAWKNVLVGSDRVKALAEQRIDICNTCEFKAEQIGIPVCGVCHCPLLGKTHSPENSCPKEKWPV